MTIEAALIAAIVALTSAVGVLWKIERVNSKELSREMKECRRDRLELWKTIAAMEARNCDVPGCDLRRPDRQHQRTAEENISKLQAKISATRDDQPRGRAATA